MKDDGRRGLKVEVKNIARNDDVFEGASQWDGGEEQKQLQPLMQVQASPPIAQEQQQQQWQTSPQQQQLKCFAGSYIYSWVVAVL